MFKNIIVPIDGSDFSLQAVDLAAPLAKEQGATCTICMVVDIVPAAAMAAATPDLVNGWLKTLDDQARISVTEAAARAQAAGARVEVASGYPPDMILNVARKHAGDLIVMGSHGRTGLKRLFMGSVAEAVLRAASVPVLVVHGKPEKASKAA